MTEASAGKALPSSTCLARASRKDPYLRFLAFNTKLHGSKISKIPIISFFSFLCPFLCVSPHLQASVHLHGSWVLVTSA